MRPANSPCAPEFGCSETSANPVISHNADSSSRKTCAYPSACSSGANGCIRLNAFHVIGSISVAAFKLRENMPIGCKVTLRGERMYEFFDRLVNLSLPRIRDFRGVPTRGFDGRGNYTLGIKEHIIFPEIDYDKIAQVFGMDITIVTSARTDEQALALLTHMKMPFRKN